MAKIARNEHGLTPQQDAYAQHLAAGFNQADAYRKAWPGTRAKPKSIIEHASKLAADSNVRTRVRGLLQKAQLHEIICPAEHLKQMLEARQEAKDGGNLTAVAAMDRTISSVLGMVRRDAVDLTVNVAVSNSEVAARLAQGDERRHAQLMKLLVAEDDFVG